MPGRHRIRAGEEYTGDDEGAELETVEPDAAIVPEAEQHGDLEHEGGPGDGDDEPEQEVPF
jgi:hypothetical protein